MSFCLKADYSNLLWNKMIKCLWGFFINMGACYPQTGPGPSNSILSSAWILGFPPTMIGYDLRLPLTFLTNILVTNMFREICKSEVLKNRLQLTNKWKKICESGNEKKYYKSVPLKSQNWLQAGTQSVSLFCIKRDKKTIFYSMVILKNTLKNLTYEKSWVTPKQINLF